MNHATGEEWRAMDATHDLYDPSADSDILRQARRGIETIRKRDVTLRLVDRSGKAIPRMRINVQQTTHAFPFGDHLWELDRFFRFDRQLNDRAKYWTLRFASVFSAANALCYWTERPRNDGPKTEDLQGDPRLDEFASCVDWALAQGLIVKGHPLVWSIPKAVPAWLNRYDLSTQMKFLEVRVRNLVARFKGKIKIWDAVNEPTWEPAWANLSRRHWPHLDSIDALAGYIAPVLQWCREEDPAARFLLNDYGLEADPPNGAPVAHDGTVATAALQRRRMLELVRRLGDLGHPPSGIGLQSHTGGWIRHARQWAVYDELAAAGLPLHVTEFWADTKHLDGKHSPDEVSRLQADYVENFLTCAFGHPSIDSFFFWGFMESAIRWHHHSSHDLTPLFERVQGLIQRQWKTSETLTTDDEGVAHFRGFLGDYALQHALSAHASAAMSFRVSPEASMPLTFAIQSPSK